MSALSDRQDGVAVYMAQVAHACEGDPRLSTLGAGILAALVLDIAHDSRGFARIFDIEHALVLREVQTLAELGRLVVTRRDARTQRCSYEAAATAPPALRAVNDRI